jgi:hypothetical protein
MTMELNEVRIGMEERFEEGRRRRRRESHKL